MAAGEILVIDDDKNLGEGLCEVFELEGLKCSRADTAAQALKTAAGINPIVVLVDMQLPDSNGFAVCQQIKRMHKSAYIIVMTGRTLTSEERIKGLQIGADDYLIKPFDLGELSLKVRQIIERRPK